MLKHAECQSSRVVCDLGFSVETHILNYVWVCRSMGGEVSQDRRVNGPSRDGYRVKGCFTGVSAEEISSL